jgi:hypothetical protein
MNNAALKSVMSSLKEPPHMLKNGPGVVKRQRCSGGIALKASASADKWSDFSSQSTTSGAKPPSHTC